MYTNGNITGVEDAILVGIRLPKAARWEVQDHLDELKQLARTSGVNVVDQIIQERERIDPATFIGKGKVVELRELAEMHEVKSIIFDDDLTPAQVRNLEKALEAKIIDRSTLILDIFADHARTRAAKTQVELAQLQYLLPRLTRQWTHLSRQVGGIGTKGPGETQLETDRRLIRQRIEHLRKELAKIDQQRRLRRRGRQELFRASLIGYTNVGKSTIMNLMSGAGVLVENQLFATLDPTVRRVQLDQSHDVLLSDTVGFIRKLPHHLVESFKSPATTEAVEADLLIHVVDISHPSFQSQINTVKEVLRDIGAADKQVLMVFNKIDRLKEHGLLTSLKREYPESVFISAARQIRTDQLTRSLIDVMERRFVEGRISLPMSQSRLVNVIHSLAVVTGEKYTDTNIILTFRCNEASHRKITRLVEQAVAGGGPRNGAVIQEKDKL